MMKIQVFFSDIQPVNRNIAAEFLDTETGSWGGNQIGSEIIFPGILLEQVIIGVAASASQRGKLIIEK